MKLRKLNRVLHRDLGYFFAGMIIIYSISGIALNHIHQWNPNYIISKTEIEVNIPQDPSSIDIEFLSSLLTEWEVGNPMSFYYPQDSQLRIFIKNGTVNINIETGEGYIETIRRRPIFREVNFLHYNTPRKWWTAFSDIFAVSLIVITITGLFMINGKNGLKRRGGLLLIAGLILPLVALLLYYK